MFTIKQVFFFILAVNCLFLVAFFVSVRDNSDRFTSSTDFLVHKNATEPSDESIVFTSSDSAPQDAAREIAALREEIRQLADKLEDNKFGADSAPAEKPKSKAGQKSQSFKSLSKTKKDKVAEILDVTHGVVQEAKKENVQLLKRRNDVQNTLRWNNPFFLLGAYPKITNKYFNSYPDGRPYYEKFNYGIINDPDYCELVDSYNLAHPENMFEKMNFFTDYAKNGLVRIDVIRKLGKDTMKQVSRYMDKSVFKTAQFHLDPTITNYFTKRVDIHIYHMIGKHFNCATQMYNHIPGHGTLKRKDLIVNSVDNYAAKYESENLGSCFNKHTFFPYSYRLYLEDECNQFFDKINGAAYKASLKQEPIQYLIKLGYGAHRAQGVFLLDRNETIEINNEYDFGRKCGQINDSVIAQTYVTNPLLLDKNNKFDFRVYMLVASTNPLMVYYHDGFLRVSLETYSKNSEDRNVHLTNTHLSKDTFAKVEKENATKAQELRDYQMWNFQRLEDYLYESGKISDRHWVDNYLRPAFKKAFIHTTRMSAYAFWDQSNVYEMFGLDFMLDDQLNLWFIECNSSPQLIGTNEHKTKFLIKMLNDLFEIEYGLYRSRMRRVLNLLHKISGDSAKYGSLDYKDYKQEYKEAVRNRFEKDYEISPNNGFELIMDMNLEGPAAYFGNIDDECAN